MKFLCQAVALRLGSMTRKDEGNTESSMRDNSFKTMLRNEERREREKDELLEGT
jgi:hypothetical protein